MEATAKTAKTKISIQSGPPAEKKIIYVYALAGVPQKIQYRSSMSSHASQCSHLGGAATS